MTLKLYYGSGSPFSWYAWLVLAHKAVAYDVERISLDGGDLVSPRYLAINSRGKVPALAGDGLVLWESSVIAEYLEQRYPEPALLPAAPEARAIVRRLAAEAHTYLYPIVRRLMVQTLFRPAGDGDPRETAAALADLGAELARFERALGDDLFSAKLSLADLAIYPLLALLRRLDRRAPQHGVAALIGPGLSRLAQRVEQQPYFAATRPPHWKD